LLLLVLFLEILECPGVIGSDITPLRGILLCKNQLTVEDLQRDCALLSEVIFGYVCNRQAIAIWRVFFFFAMN
jgi:hypothetical protein